MPTRPQWIFNPRYFLWDFGKGILPVLCPVSHICMCGAQQDCCSQGWHLPLRKKVVSRDVFSVSTRERKIGKIGPEVKVQLIWHVTAVEWEESRLCYQPTKGHGRASEFLFRLLVVLCSNFDPIVRYPPPPQVSSFSQSFHVNSRINNYRLNWIDPQSNIILQKLIFPHIIKKFPPFYETWKIISLFTTLNLTYFEQNEFSLPWYLRCL